VLKGGVESWSEVLKIPSWSVVYDFSVDVFCNECNLSSPWLKLYNLYLTPSYNRNIVEYHNISICFQDDLSLINRDILIHNEIKQNLLPEHKLLLDSLGIQH
jgi:hypothetical protein